jgi:hypothetical protein
MSHAKYAPSAAHRWLECPGSVALCAQLPPAPDSVYAAEGTFAHALAAWCLQRGKNASEINVAEAMLLARAGADEGEPEMQQFPVTQEMRVAIQLYLNYVRDLQVCYGGTLCVEIRAIVVDLLCKGTADAAVVAAPVLHVVDFKYGAGHLVEAEDNPQLLLYAYGLRLAATSTVVLHIVQPRRLDSHGGAVRTTTISAADLAIFGHSVVQHVNAIEDGVRTELIPGTHCRWCPAAARCPRLQESANTAVAEVFRKNAEVAKPPALSELSAEELGKALDLRERIVAYLDRVEAHAREEAHKGTKIPGWKLVEVQGHRKWRDEGVAAEALTKFGVDPYAPRELLSPAQAEAKLGRAKAEALVPKLVTRPVSIKLVRQSDKRAEVLSVQQMFQPLNEENES